MDMTIKKSGERSLEKVWFDLCPIQVNLSDLVALWEISSTVPAVYRTVIGCRLPATHQVDEVTEVLLDLLGRQTPHQVQSTIQLLVILKYTMSQLLIHIPTYKMHRPSSAKESLKASCTLHFLSISQEKMCVSLLILH